jgi:hypothetical protein
VKLFKFLRRAPPVNIPKPKSKGKAKTQRPARKKRQGFLAGLWKWIRWVLAGVGCLVSAGAIALAYFAYYPRVFVDPPSATTSPTRPFSEPFMLKNIGSIPIYSVSVDCGPPVGIASRFTTGPPELEPGESADVKASFKINVFTAPELRPQERHPFTCSGFVPESTTTSLGRTSIVVEAFVRVKVYFKLFGLPKVFSNDFPFEGTLGDDGAVHWHETFLNEQGPTEPSPKETQGMHTVDAVPNFQNRPLP